MILVKACTWILEYMDCDLEFRLFTTPQQILFIIPTTFSEIFTRRHILNGESAQLPPFWFGIGLGIDMLQEKEVFSYNIYAQSYQTKKVKIAHFRHSKRTFFYFFGDLL